MTKKIFYALGLTLLIGSIAQSARASTGVARGCRSLLNSSDPNKAQQLYDRRNYYDHSMRYGYTLKKELATQDVSKYYASFFRIAKALKNSLAPPLTKEEFCTRNLSNLSEKRNIASETSRKVYRGDEKEDCRSLLADACKSEAVLDAPKLPLLRLSAAKQNDKTKQLDRTIPEVFESEQRYHENIAALLHIRLLVERILQTMDPTGNLSNHFGLLSVHLQQIAAHSEVLLNQVERDGLDGPHPKRLTVFFQYFAQTPDIYKKYETLHGEFKKEMDAYAAKHPWEARFLDDLNQFTLFTPVQRVTRYPLLLEAVSKSFGEESTKEDRELVQELLDKARRFSQSINEK